MNKKSEKKGLEKEEKELKKAEKKKKEKKAKTKSVSKIGEITPEQRREMITTAAYYIAERHGFTPGRSHTDWREAEKEIDSLLKEKGKKKKRKS
jgi:hypothetical protein